MYLTLLFLPLLGTVLPMLSGGAIGVTGSRLVTTGAVALSALLAIVAFIEVCISGSPVSIDLGHWVSSGTLAVHWAFLFDGLTLSMLLPVLAVSTMVHLYSFDYMGSDPHQQRFFSYLSLFTFWMVLLVTGDNYFILFLGWEGIGVSSYLLISFWYTRLQAVKSAMEAMIVNRVGDTFLSLGIYVSFWALGSVDYGTVFSVTAFVNETSLTVLGLLLLLAAMGKSAQLGLHTWLPLAMEGPTPVSALIHAATLVTAGVYLLLRSSPLLVYAPTSLICITWVGAITAVFAATTGLVQNDIKRVIAYSTCSQMGYLFMAVGLSAFDVGLFHLVNHAFFKAVLFLSAGGVLHSMTDQQDMRRLGGLVQLLPFTYVIILIGSLSLMALPFLTGFYSKDMILESGYGAYTLSGHLVYWLGTFTAFLTAFYSFRLISLTFLTTPNANRSSYEHTHEQPLIVIWPLCILAILSIGFGYIAKDTFLGLGTDTFGTAILTRESGSHMIEAEFALPQWAKTLPFAATLMGAFCSMVAYNWYSLSSTKLILSNAAISAMYDYLIQKWQFDILINHFVIRTGLGVGYLSSQVIDKGLFEIIGPRGLTNALYIGSDTVSALDTGKITDYALLIMVGFTALVLVAYASLHFLLFGTLLPEDLIVNLVLLVYLLH